MHALITGILFSLFAAIIIQLAGRRDPARDSRLTGWALGLLVCYPVLVCLLPKLIQLPAAEASTVGEKASWIGMGGWVWLAGFLAMICRLLAAAKAVHAWKVCSIVVDRRDGVEVRMVLGTRLTSPVAVGVFRPVILVPSSWRWWSDETRRIVIEHELAHHRRKDPLLRWMAELACAVHWFNPMVWWMARKFVMQCEYACDASVIAMGVNKRRYVDVLCDLAGDGSGAASMVAMADRSTLEKRVIRLAAYQGERPSPGPPWWMVGTILALAGAALAMIGPPHDTVSSISASEVETRWAANPFPGESD